MVPTMIPGLPSSLCSVSPTTKALISSCFHFQTAGAVHRAGADEVAQQVEVAVELPVDGEQVAQLAVVVKSAQAASKAATFCRAARCTKPGLVRAAGGGRWRPSGVGYLEGGDVAGGAAELDADEVNRLAGGAVLFGVAALLSSPTACCTATAPSWSAVPRAARS